MRTLSRAVHFTMINTRTILLAHLVARKRLSAWKFLQRNHRLQAIFKCKVIHFYSIASGVCFYFEISEVEQII